MSLLFYSKSPRLLHHNRADVYRLCVSNKLNITHPQEASPLKASNSSTAHELPVEFHSREYMFISIPQKYVSWQCYCFHDVCVYYDGLICITFDNDWITLNNPNRIRRETPYKKCCNKKNRCHAVGTRKTNCFFRFFKLKHPIWICSVSHGLRF